MLIYMNIYECRDIYIVMLIYMNIYECRVVYMNRTKKSICSVDHNI